MLQHTIKKTIECLGIGLHSGRPVSLTLRPAPENTGILFCQRHGGGSRFISLSPKVVVDTGLATTIGLGEDRIATVEHLLAAIRGLEIDNIQIDLDGREVPILDGSAASFVLLLHSAGLREQSAPRQVLAIKKPFSFVQGEKSIKATPYNGFRVSYFISFPHPRVGEQSLTMDITSDNFVNGLAKARTFGFLKDVEMLKRNGLALGGSLENAVVLDEYNVLNPEGLRFEDEFVRHKILDFIGDMAIYGLPLRGAFEVRCSGHGLNNAFLRALEENQAECLEKVTLNEPARKLEPALHKELGVIPGYQAKSGVTA